MSETVETPVAEQESHEEQVRTVTIEQFEELRKQLEETRKAQSGSDRTVTELRKALELKEKEAENASKTQEEKFAERLQQIEDELNSTKAEKQRAILKNHAMQLLTENGVKSPKYLDRLIGKDAEETEELIMAYVEDQLETKLSAADEIAKRGGRKIEKGKSDMRMLSDYTDEELASMSDDELLKVQERSKTRK